MSNSWRNVNLRSWISQPRWSVKHSSLCWIHCSYSTSKEENRLRGLQRNDHTRHFRTVCFNNRALYSVHFAGWSFDSIGHNLHECNLYAWILWNFIKENAFLKSELMKSKNQKNLFIASFLIKLEEYSHAKSWLEATCNKGHPFRPKVKRIATAMFNCFGVNFKKEANSVIHSETKRKIYVKKCVDNRKILKLTSGGSVSKTVDSKGK